MPPRDRERKKERGVEFALSMVALLVLLPCLALVFFARWHVEVPADALLINDATPEKFALALNLDIDLADRLVSARSRLGGFTSVDSLLDVRLFDPAETERLGATLVVSHLDPRTATARQFAAVLGLTPAVASRLAAARDEIAGEAAERSTTGSARTSGSAAPRAPDALTPERLDALLMKRAMLLDAKIARPLLGHLLVRRPATVFWHFTIVSTLLALISFFLPPWLRNRLRVSGDPFLIPMSLLLSGLGVVMLFSVKDPLRDVAAYEHHLSGIVISALAMVVCARLAPAARQRIKGYQYVWALGAALLALLLFLFGRGPEGVRLNLLGFQPVELIKLMLVFFLASYLSSRADLIADTTPRNVAGRNAPSRLRGALPRRQDLGPVILLFALSLTLFYVIQDLGPGLLLFATFISLLYLTTGRISFVVAGVALLIAGGALGYYRHIGVFATRVDMWLAPFANRHPNGMQLGQSYWALASGGWSGSGLGMGMPALIPRGQDDLAFISWTEETGLPGAWLLLLIYVTLVWRGVRIAIRAGTDFDRALAFGLTALLGLQSLLILAGVTGLAPLTGISLPFLCYGDSALFAAFVSVGLLRGISAPPSGGVGRPEARLEVVRAGRRFALAFTFALLGVIGLYRLFQVQIVSADAIASRPVITPDADGVSRPHQNPRLLTMADDIERGSIYDRNGRILATSRPKEVLSLIRDPDRARRLIAVRTRLYPYGAALSDLVGYVDPASGGPYALERNHNSELRGYAHLKDLLADYRSRHDPGYVPRRGRDLHLSIDAALQREAQNLLWEATGHLKDERNGRPKDRAAFVLLDPQTGDVIVAASIPTFDPNTLTPAKYHQIMSAKEPDQEYPFIDRAISGYYPPGSTLKVATAAIALDSLPNAVSFQVTCDRVGEVRWHAHGRAYARTIHDDRGDPSFGPLTLASALRVSSNIYFATLAAAVGPDTLRAALVDKMGFRQAPSLDDFDVDLADIGYGQGRMLTSPLQMARLAACVANEGKMMEARLVTGVSDPAGLDKKQTFPPAVRSQAMAPPTAAALREMMRSVVTGGTAQGIFDGIAVPVAGKTGTAQNHQSDRQPHSWFIGFAPSGDRANPNAAPRYAFACIVENGGYGRTVAAAVCRGMLRRLF